MNIRVGYIPFLNMVPFHQGFGPSPLEVNGRRFEFHSVSPRALGVQAEKGVIDAGAFSLVDWLRLSSQYEAIGSYGVGIKGPAQSVYLFSKRPISELRGFCAVSDETSTSFQLLRLILEVRYGLSGQRYGRIASSVLFDGDADALLLIGDEALKAKFKGVRGLPYVADLGEEWFKWQGVPFVFARWAVRRALHQDIKDIIEEYIEKSLKSTAININNVAKEEAEQRGLSSQEVMDYWNGFVYRLTAGHEHSIALFAGLLEQVPLVR